MKKHQVILCLIAIIALGFFLRAYHFSDWLHFELDQARDARVVDVALEGGAADLPLLGPKAAGTFLRLAPTFYHLEYLSAVVFGGTPSGMAVFVLLFSVASLPVFYFLARRFFPAGLALGLTLLFAVSHYFVMYGRFAWNPNLLPFFILLGLYALLRATDTEESRRGRWFIGAAASLAVATHFHFLAFLSLPVIAVLFLLYKRPRFSWQAWVLAIGVALLSYLPMFLNELEAGFTNTEEFRLAITEKSAKGDDHVLIEKFFRDVAEHALHAVVVTTGFEGATFPAFFWEEGSLKWNCPDKCDDGKWYGVAAALMLLVALTLTAVLWWRETDMPKRDFLALALIWFAVTFGLFLPLSYAIAPRFFLLSGPLFFLLIGILLLGALRLLRNKRWGILLATAVIGTFAFSNLSFLFQRFSQLDRAGSELVENAPDRILKERIRVTLEQQEAIVDFLERRSREADAPVYMFSEPQYRRALKYLMEKRGLENDVLGFSGIYRQGVHYLILRSRSDLEDALLKYRQSYQVGEQTSFGTLVAIELIPLPEAIQGERQDFSKPEKPAPSSAPPRYTWREFFERQGEPVAEDEGENEEAE